MFSPLKLLRKRLLAFALCTALLYSPLPATWSIVVVNLKTGEVAIASATCIPNFNLKTWSPMVLPEVGAAAAQSLIDGGQNRILIREQMLLETDLDQILMLLDNQDNQHQWRQYGMVDLQGQALTFTGTQAGGWAGGVTGQQGDMVYAIQGNVLTGQPVVQQAELALLNTPGDLAEKLMAAMEAARDMGGDGRCSCDQFMPESCGSPPANFQRSANVGYLIVTRPGDTKGPCGSSGGCARGSYYLSINISQNGATGPDPVDLIRTEYDAWRLAQSGRPDAVHSQYQIDKHEVQAGSAETIRISVQLFDIDQIPLTQGGATFRLDHELGSADLAALNQVIDNGNGTYELEIPAGLEAGLDRFRIVVDDGVREVQLTDIFEVLHTPAPRTPFNDLSPVAGLSDSSRNRNAVLLADQLTAYWLSDRNGNGWEMFRATRLSPNDPFGIPEIVAGLSLPNTRITDYWISNDELEIVLSGFAKGSTVEQIFLTERPTPQDAFSEPQLVEELNSGLGDGDPWLSGNRQEVFFRSERSGQFGIWRAERRRKDAVWREPELVLEAAAGEELAGPLLFDGDTRLLISKQGSGGTHQLFFTRRTGSGSFVGKGLLPGAVHRQLTDVAATSVSTDAQKLWVQLKGGLNYQVLEATATTSALSASNDVVSLSAGGMIDLTLDAGSTWGGQFYYLAASGTGSNPATLSFDAAVPLVFDLYTRRSLQRPQQRPLENFQGFLDTAGKAQARFIVPAGSNIDPALLNRPLPVAFLALNGARGFASNPVRITLIP